MNIDKRERINEPHIQTSLIGKTGTCSSSELLLATRSKTLLIKQTKQRKFYTRKSKIFSKGFSVEEEAEDLFKLME